MSARRLLVAVFCALAGTFWLGAGLAGATKVVSGSFGSSGAGAGQFSTTAPGAVAVNATGEGGVSAGDVYVVDRSNFRINEFSASGGFVRAFGLNVGGAGIDVCTVTCQAGTSSAAAGGLVFPEGIAIDQATGAVYVSDETNHRIDVFSATGTFEGAFGWNVESAGANTLQFCTTTCQAGTAGAGVGEIGTAGGYLAVSSTGDVYLGDYTNKRVDEFAPAISAGAVTGVSFVHAFGWGVVNGASELQSCTTVSGCEAGLSGAGAGEFGTSAIQGIAIDSTGAIYVANEPATCAATNPCRVQKFNAAGTSASEFAAAQLTRTSGTSSSEAVNQIAVEASNNDVYLARPNTGATERDVLVFAGNGNFLATDGLGAGLPAATGLAVGAGGRLYFPEITNHEVYILQKPTYPSIDAFFSANVASTSVTLQAQVDPNGADTHYYIQYGGESCVADPSGCTDLQTPPGLDIGASETDQVVDVHLQALLPDTLYHYRIVASNATETTEAEATFTTQGVGGPLTLLDGREWELVSPPVKYGAGIIPQRREGDMIAASAAGDAISYIANNPVELEPEGNAAPEASQIIARRAPGGGWVNRTLDSPKEETQPLPAGDPLEYEMFSEDLSRAIMFPWGTTPLSPSATKERAPYLREEAACQEGSSSCFTPFLTREDTMPGAEWDPNPPYTVPGLLVDEHFRGATPDLSDSVFSSQVKLLEDGGEASMYSSLREGLYEFSAEGQLRFVSVNAAGVPVTGGFAGPRNAISSDGSRIIWCEEHCERSPLLMRDMATEETLTIAAGLPASEATAFQAANADDSKIFYTVQPVIHEQQLWECEVVEGAGGKLECVATEVAPETVGLTLGINEAATIVYFVSTAALAGEAKAGMDNLYVASLEDGKWEPRFIATLSSDDAHDWDPLEQMSARVASNGRYLAFMSDRSLTGYDNHDATSGEPDQEVYLYDEQTGRLACASCNPTGARPQGTHLVFEDQTLANSQSVWRSNWVAATIPTWENSDLQTPLGDPRYLSNSGQLFFGSSDDLVPQDTNGLWDVYEYEPEGAGGCAQAEGCVGLVSSGKSGQESVFLEASASGDDVFFITTAQLVPEDQDTAFDVYDAHVCSSAVPCTQSAVTPSPCSNGEACKAPQTPQPSIFGAPASATFSGAGNLESKPAKRSTPGGKKESRKGGASSKRQAERKRRLKKALKACRRAYGGQAGKRRGCESRAHRRYGGQGTHAASTARHGHAARGNGQGHAKRMHGRGR
jgi:hypothetical protein